MRDGRLGSQLGLAMGGLITTSPPCVAVLVDYLGSLQLELVLMVLSSSPQPAPQSHTAAAHAQGSHVVVVGRVCISTRDWHSTPAAPTIVG